MLDLDSVTMVELHSGTQQKNQWVCIETDGGRYQNILCGTEADSGELFFLLCNLLEFRRLCDINGSWGKLEAP